MHNREILSLEHQAEIAPMVRALATQELDMRFGDFRQVAIEEIVAFVSARMGVFCDTSSEGPPAYVTSADYQL
jgi:hypothetical protein